MNKNVLSRFGALSVTMAAVAFFPAGLFAITANGPIASTVPFVASNPTSPHTSWAGNPVILKGTMTSPLLGTDSFTWDFDPGDGGAHCTGTIDASYQTTLNPGDNPYILACPHTYSGSVGTVYTAVLNVTDTTISASAASVNCPPSITSGACYYTSINNPPPNLAVEVNNAIDNGLWYLHTMMQRTTSSGGANIGNWYLGGGAGNVDSQQAGGTGVDSSNCVAFENSGFLQTNTPANPYSDDVARCVANTFDQLVQRSIGSVSISGFSSYNPDSNGNGISVGHNGYPENYQTGMMLDAIAAAGTPNAVIPANTALAQSNPPGGSGAGGAYTYKDTMIDMVDEYAYCVDPSSDGFGSAPGGWHYSCQEQDGDNSVSQWAAIGIIPARRKVGLTAGFDPLNNVVLALDQNWLGLSYSQASTNNGFYGYTSNSTLWGPYADTPSGLVQLAMNGLGRGTSINGVNQWDGAETFMRDNFGNAPGAEDCDCDPGSLKGYYYGMYSFTKAMLLHDNNDSAYTALPSPSGTPGFGSPSGLNTIPITLLQSADDSGNCALPIPEFVSTPGDSGPGTGTGPCYPPLDWYGAQTAAYGGSDATDGVARTLVSTQNSDGSWFGHNSDAAQFYLETGIAVTMLNKTVFQPVPVACFTVNPSHVASGGPVTLDGGCSVDQNPDNHLVSWQWDIDGTGGTTFTVGPGSPQCLTPSCSKMIANFSLPAGKSLPYNYPVRLRVTDSATPPLTADVVNNVVIANPPNPPNANAGGPYNFCPNTKAGGGLIYAPFLLDGSRSTNPDQGQTDGTPGATPSTIVSYLWDYSCSGQFNSASGAQVNATTAFDVPADFGTTFNVCLQVTNNDNLAFPTAGLSAGLSSVSSAQVSIHQPTDEVCTHCIQTLTGQAKAPTPGHLGNIQLYFTDTNTSSQFTIDHYNIYRSTSATFNPFTEVAGSNSSPFSAAVPVSVPAGGLLEFTDNNVVAGTTYYYRVAPATANDTETCQGNVTLSVTLPKGR